MYMKDQATPLGQCLMENKRINEEKYHCYIGKFALNSCFTWSQYV